MDLYDADFYSIIRMLFFFMMIGLFIILEVFIPLHSLGKEGGQKRRLLNWGVGMLSAVIAIPLSTLSAALFCEQYNFGLFHYFTVPLWLGFILWFLINDLVYYSYHRLAHAHRFFWYFHKVHHSDKSLNTTTAIRFHPLEYLAVNFIKISAIFIFGPYFIIIFFCDVIQAVIMLWAHSNLKINKTVERYLSLFIVTPRYHVLHHLEDPNAKNFATVLTIWDRLTKGKVDPIFEEEKINNLKLGLGPDKCYDNLTSMLLLDRLIEAIKKTNFAHFKYSLLTITIMIGFWILALFYPSVTQGMLGINVWWSLLYLVLACHFTMIVVSIYLHRSETHRAVRFHLIIRHIFRFWLWLATGTNRSEWVAVHRAHHQAPDTDKDPHSPAIYGLKTLFTSGFELYHKAKSEQVVEKYGIISDNDYLEKHWYSKYSIIGPIILLVIEILLVGIWAIPLWTLQMILQIMFQASIINGLGHYLGYRNFETKDKSHNITSFGLLIAGEELHNNHHQYPASAKFSFYSNEVDIGWIYILLLKKLGLARIKLKPLAKANLEFKKYRLKEE
ncbi:putative sterol desaturase [Legionella busanensis]|uniref:Putative sterol desaturase n=2 Tax=Legionella busanensis TaxID=190655 RepID=A0A378JHM7_9GAMM|nr:sterol desaturase family protein [Legionella busanensis]STX50188.1 putative sterol desaturase [Legionella busanensis]